MIYGKLGLLFILIDYHILYHPSTMLSIYHYNQFSFPKCFLKTSNTNRGKRLEISCRTLKYSILKRGLYIKSKINKTHQNQFQKKRTDWHEIKTLTIFLHNTQICISQNETTFQWNKCVPRKLKKISNKSREGRVLLPWLIRIWNFSAREREINGIFFLFCLLDW